MVPALHRMTPADFMDCDAKYRNVFTSTDTPVHIRIMCIACSQVWIYTCTYIPESIGE